jgi:8-oxo-dGTP diphosphatase
MKQADQGLSSNRYVTIPRTLVFILNEDRLLLLRGDPRKTRWANQLNGIGGHIEPDEDPWVAAQREVLEETGLRVRHLQLVALVHISDPGGVRGAMLFVFLARAPSTEVCPSAEGQLAWYPLAELPWGEMVDDLPVLLPRVLDLDNAAPGSARLIYGLYTPDREGQINHSFRCSS